jgi:uncharacterized protein DUF4230
MSTQLRDRASNNDVTVRVVADGGRRRFSLLGVLTTVVAGALAVGMVLIAGVLTGVLSIGNPFATSTVDRSGPAMMKQLNDLSQYRAARAKFQQTVDVEDDVGILPSFVAGERTVFQAYGSVDATVDFSSLSKDAVQKTGDNAITVTLPKPHLAPAVIDPRTSHVIDRDRGLVNRVGDLFSDNPGGDQRFYVLAQRKLHDAAEESTLLRRAERNTTEMLQGMLGKLGYSNVTVVYTDPVSARQQS